MPPDDEEDEMRSWLRRAVPILLGVALLAVPSAASGDEGGSGDARHSLRAPLTGDNFYFVMADRFENGSTANDLGGLPADRLVSGFDPTAKGFYHGGDLAGIRQRLSYVRDLGTTAIWLTPSFKNKAVQLEDGPSAGYHGYWITDFTQIDPHLGTNAELAALIHEAHGMGMKVFFDIITNHTADVIDYEEAHRPAYVSKDQVPYRTASGTPFDDRDYAGTNRFPPLSRTESFPFTPFNPPDAPVKVPDWLNDVTLYHNRGNTTFVGENSYYGDFFGLDDLFTEHPRVVRGMIDIYQAWIRDFGIDGFRIDTMKHVDDEFWQRFAPEVLTYARQQGKREFFMFGEVFDTTKSFTSHFTTHDRVQAVLDFPFQQAAQNFAANSHPTDELRDFFVGDDWYTDADSNAYQLPTFLGNHDMGRIGRFVKVANGDAGDAELLARDRLAHALMYLSRGNPVIYYGDEQGFTGDGGDQDARQDMFPSQVASYNDDDLIGTDETTATDNFDADHPLYQSIGELARVTSRHPALRDGAQQHRWSSSGPGVYAFSRLDRHEQHEYVVAVNNAEQAQTAAVPTYQRGTPFQLLYGSGPARLVSGADKRLGLTVEPLSAVVYRATKPLERSHRAPAISLADPGELRDRAEVRADPRRRRVRRGDLPGQGRRRRLEADRHRRQRPLPRLPRRRRPGPRHAGPVQGRRPGQRRPRPRQPGPQRHRGTTGHRAGGADRRRPGARHGRGPRGRHPGPPALRGDLLAPGRRRALDGDRHRHLLAGLHRVRRHHGAGRRQRGALPGGPDLRARQDGQERHPQRDRGHRTGDDRGRPLYAPGRRLRRLGAAPVG